MESHNMWPFVSGFFHLACQHFIPCYGWIIFHCMNRPHSVLHSSIRGCLCCFHVLEGTMLLWAEVCGVCASLCFHPFWEPSHTWHCWTMRLILCLTVWGTAIVLSMASAASYPHQQNTSDHFSTSLPILIILWVFGSIWSILMNSYHHGH